MHKCILRELVVMKTLFLAFLIIMPLTSQAICLQSYNLKGSGKTPESAQEALEIEARVRCGNDEWSWPARKSQVTLEEILTEEGLEFKASARYQCCMQW
jgi:hypothetical protein